MLPIHFVDLLAQQTAIRPKLEAAMLRVLDHGQYIMGPEVAAFEAALADFCGVKYVMSCSNGTDALALGLRAKGVKPGHAIFVPSFSFSATAEVVAWMGAEVIFVDVQEDTFDLDAASLEHAIQVAQNAGLSPQGVIPVDLFGQPADYEKIEPIVEKYGLWMMVDAAQSFGATYKGRAVGTIGTMTTTSFFPAKPLGAYGDGGALFTNDEELAETIKSLRVHGQGRHKYENLHIGMNARLDTLQAAILLEKLAIFPEEIKKRQAIASRYTQGLGEHVETPKILSGVQSVWAQYTIKLPRSIDREELICLLKANHIPAMIYYPKPLHLQPCYAKYSWISRDYLVHSEEVAARVLSLPMHPYLSQPAQDHIIETVVDLLT